MQRHEARPADIFEEMDFSGGVNLVDAETELPRGHLVQVINLIISTSGGLRLRRGNNVLDVPLTGVGAITIRGLGRCEDSSGVSKRVAVYLDAFDSKIHVKRYSAGAWVEVDLPTATTNYVAIAPDTTARMRMLMAGNLLIFFNGTDRVICWDGNDAHDINFFGVTAPTSILGFSTYAPGSDLAAGNYWYMYAYKNTTYAFVSSVKSPIENVHPGGFAALVSIPQNAALDPGVNAVRLYRSTAQPSITAQPPPSAFYFLAEVTSYTGAVKTYVDNTSDTNLRMHASFLSEFSGGENDHDLPPDNVSRAVMHKSRLFVICEGDDLVYFSNVNDEAYFTPGNDYEIDAGTGAGLNQVAGMENGVILLKQEGMSILDTYGASSSWKVRKISTRGCIAPDTMRVVQDISGAMGVMRLAKDGLSLGNEEADVLCSDNVWPLLRQIPVDAMQDLYAMYAPGDGIYALLMPDYFLMSNYDVGSPGLLQHPSSGVYIGMRALGYIDPIPVPMPEGINILSIKSFFFHLRKPVRNVRDEYMGLACTFGTRAFKHVLDKVTVSDPLIYGVNTNNGAILKIWDGYQDYGAGDELEDMPFSIITRPYAPGTKLTSRRYEKLFIRTQSQDLYFELNAILDFGVFNRLYENLSGLVASTRLGTNPYDRAAAPTFGVDIGGALTTGTYYYFFMLSDSADPSSITMLTQASEISAGHTITGPLGITVVLPDVANAAAKGYIKYLVFRGSGTTTPDWGDFEMVGTASLNAGFSVNYGDAGGALPSDQLLPGTPPDELRWSTPGMRNVEVRFGARMVGNFLSLHFFGMSGDPYLIFIGVGLKYKQKVIS